MKQKGLKPAIYKPQMWHFEQVEVDFRDICWDNWQQCEMQTYPLPWTPTCKRTCKQGPRVLKWIIAMVKEVQLTSQHISLIENNVLSVLGVSMESKNLRCLDV